MQELHLFGHDYTRVDLAILIGAGIYTFTNYVGQKYFVFK
jgi:hypothetical protein